MVSRNRGEDVRAHGVPEDLLVLAIARRGRVDVLRTLEVGALEVRVVDEEVLRARLAPDIPSLLAGARDRVDGLLAGDVDDVERSAGDTGELDGAVRRLPFELGRPRQGVEVRRGVPGGECLLDQNVDRIAVLRMHHDERAGVGGDLHRAEERLVVDHERALVGHEELVRGDALLGQSRELLERPALAQVGHRDVEAHVDDLLPLTLAVPGVERVGERAARGLDAEVDVAGRPAERRRRLPRGDVVDRGRPAERHVEMRVRVDAPRQDVLARRVDDAIRIDVERLTQHRDALAVDVNVADVVVGGRDDPPARDQCRHVMTSIPSVGELRTGPSRTGPEPTPRPTSRPP